MEFYNKQNAEQLAFASPTELANFAKTVSGNYNINDSNVFDVIKQGFTPISSTTPPTPTATPDLPKPTAADTTTAYVTSLTTDLEAKRKTVEDTYNKQLETIRAQQAESQKKIDELTTKQANTLEQDVQPLLQPFRENLEKSERERLKVEENFFANQKITEELQTLLTQGNDLIAKAQKENVPLVFKGANVNKVMSDIAARAGVLEATLAARNNQIAQAYNLIDRSVQATVADRQDRLKYFSTILDFYENQKDEAGNKLLNLDKEEQSFVSAQIGLLESDLANSQKTADYLKGLMVDPETAKFISDAGVTLNDSVEAINQKMAEQTKRIEVQAQQKTNREEAFNAGIATQFYDKSGEIVRTSDGFAFSSPEQFQQMTGMTLAEAQAKGLISRFDANRQSERALVVDLASKYVDAGITPSDSLATAQNKVTRSRIYQDQVRPPASSGGSGGGVLGLTNQQIDNISPLVTQFQNSDIVRNYNTIGEGYSFVRSLSNETTNPADDQALIYALAKALDPGSVVREGEYATVQKYAQSLVQSYGKSVNQALTGSGFLSADARKNIKSTIESRFKAAETSYKNLYTETERRVNLIGNTDKGSQLLNNYGGAFAQPSANNSVIQPRGEQASSTEGQSGTTNSQSFLKKAYNWLFGD